MGIHSITGCNHALPQEPITICYSCVGIVGMYIYIYEPANAPYPCVCIHNQVSHNIDDITGLVVAEFAFNFVALISFILVLSSQYFLSIFQSVIDNAAIFFFSIPTH